MGLKNQPELGNTPVSNALRDVLKSLAQRYLGRELREKLMFKQRWTHFDSLQLRYSKGGCDEGGAVHHIRFLEKTSSHVRHCGPLVIVHSFGASYHCSLISLPMTTFSEDYCPMGTLKITYACKVVASKPALTWALENVCVAVKQVVCYDKNITLAMAVGKCGRKLILEPNTLSAMIMAVIWNTRAMKVRLVLCPILLGVSVLDTDIAIMNYSQSTMSRLGTDVDELSLEISIYEINQAVFFPSSKSFHPASEDRQANEGCRNVLLDSNSNKLLAGEPITIGSSEIMIEVFDKRKTVAVKTLPGCGGMVFNTGVVSRGDYQHEKVVILHGIGIRLNNKTCLVKEYLEFGSLKETLEMGGKVKLEYAIRIFRYTVETLMFLHDRGVVHRCLSSCILFGGNGRAAFGYPGTVQYKNNDHLTLREILVSNPGSLVVTFMNTIYLIEIIVWEMVIGSLLHLFSLLQATLYVANYDHCTIPDSASTEASPGLVLD